MEPRIGASAASVRVSWSAISAAVSSVKSGWSHEWFAKSNRSGRVAASCIAAMPWAVCVPDLPVGKRVACTSWSMSHWTMSTAGSSRPPMSNVSAMSLTVRGPWKTTFAGGAVVGCADGPTDGPAVGGRSGVAFGSGLGVGGLFSSTTIPGMSTSTQPTSRRFGS